MQADHVFTVPQRWLDMQPDMPPVATTAAGAKHQERAASEMPGAPLARPVATPRPRAEPISTPTATPLAYVFTAPPPARSAASEPAPAQRISERREIVELIRREVQAQTEPARVLSRFTRADYGRIADRVAASLARELTLERERRGLI